MPAACASINRTTASVKAPPDSLFSGLMLPMPNRIISPPLAAASMDSATPWRHCAEVPISGPVPRSPPGRRIAPIAGLGLAYRPAIRRSGSRPRWRWLQGRPVPTARTIPLQPSADVLRVGVNAQRQP